MAIAGGIGAGKSCVSERLTVLGWPVVDADVVARRVVEPGTPAWRALRDGFGSAVLAADGTVDRTFLADVVFGDESALRRLNRVTHGHIGREILRDLDVVTGDAVFVVLPLFRPEHRDTLSLDAVWAVQAAPGTAVERLRRDRGLGEDEAQARLAAQMTNEERERVVDRVLWNDASIEDLYAQLDVLLRLEGLSRA